ncbi:cytochrome c oxidase assembly protein COX20, mitochondrial-like isoform X2 [Lytechinus variegatus]|uniref:cytochrome c oxidase assembly protein COX20, mitochondrial-like isoform X2 n=1 Tax=Lytechinus variegatus TaxID=7654 RepID=UPI001BB1167E|nr:cytochrome c oxidase assembly protein COX20, mitochondrial-like isoform X2 [Lytechinus variegatus]
MAGIDNDDNQSESWLSRVTGEFHRVPCMRTAFLYGIGGGFGVGLATFLFTSRVKRSTDMGVLSFIAVTLSSFTYCRYNRAKMTIQQRRFRELQGLEPREVSHQYKPER